MTIHIFDIIQYGKNPEIFSREFPEKYKYLQKQFSKKENRESYFHYLQDIQWDETEVAKPLQQELDYYYQDFLQKIQAKKSSPLYRLHTGLFYRITTPVTVILAIMVFILNLFGMSIQPNDPTNGNAFLPDVMPKSLPILYGIYCIVVHLFYLSIYHLRYLQNNIFYLLSLLSFFPNFLFLASIYPNLSEPFIQLLHGIQLIFFFGYIFFLAKKI